MLREAKEIAVNMTTTVVVIGVGLAFLAGLGAILAREAYRGRRGTSTPRWPEEKWPNRVRKTLLEDEPSGLDQL
jgi:hypothetical protein